MSAIDELYLVQNGIDDVVDNDHNTLVDAVQLLNSTFGGTYNFGNGRDGNLKLGAISPNPTTAPTVLSNGTGDLTGTYYYKYTVYNLSGETVGSSASSAVSPSSQYVTVNIPPFANNTNVTGFYIYRSVDNVTYYKVGIAPVDNATSGATFIDNIPITSGAAPAGSNTTGTSATVYGTYYAKSVNITSGTLTLNSTYPFLNIICQGDVTFNGTFSGSGLVAGGAHPDYAAIYQGLGVNAYDGLSTKGSPAFVGGESPGAGMAVFPSTAQLWKSTSRFIYKQGEGGIGGSTPGKAGGTLFIAAQGKVDLSSANISLNGGNGAASFADGGGAGGIFVCAAGKYVKTSGTVISANGGNASTGTYSTLPAASGGGGGLVVILTDNISSVVGSPTITVNGGSAGASNGSGSGFGAKGGGCGGASGSGVAGTSAGNPGSVGISNIFTSNQMAIPVI